MLATVTNLTTDTLNALDTIDSSSTDLTGPASLLATGGSRVRQLPYPFDGIELAASGSKELPMNPRDFHYKAVYGIPTEAGEDMAQLVQKGIISVAISAQTDQLDVEALNEGADS